MNLLSQFLHCFICRDKSLTNAAVASIAVHSVNFAQIASKMHVGKEDPAAPVTGWYSGSSSGSGSASESTL